MKKILFTLSLLSISTILVSQSACNNIDFENGNHNSWIKTLGTACNTSPACYTYGSLGTNASDPDSLKRHLFINSAGFDQVVSTLPIQSPNTVTGMNLRLGNLAPGAQAEETFISYTIPVFATTLKFHYAFVCDEGGGVVSTNDLPFFYFEILDSLNQPLGSPINYLVNSADTSLITFAGSTKYNAWKTLNINVTQIAGRSIKLRVINSDGTSLNSFGRVYFDFECALNTTSIDNIDQDVLFIYPNPSYGNFKVDVKEKGVLNVVNLNGELMQSYNANVGVNNFDLSYLNNGTYFVIFETLEGKKSIERLQIIK